MNIRKRDANETTAKMVSDSVHAFGIDATCIRFGIKEKTVKNYILLNNAYNIASDRANSKPKILVFDIETSLIFYAGFGVWQQNIKPETVLRDWHMISWAGKWLFDDDVFGDVQTSEEAMAGDDSRISKSLWDAIDKADIVIAHNGDKFDIKRMNTRFMMNNLGQPSPYKSIDTLKTLKAMFSITYNRLDYVNKVLGLDVKSNHSGMQMWLDCAKGDNDALTMMYEYNRNDVVILEEMYLAIRGWIKNHPNIAVYYDSDKPICHKCGSDSLELSEGIHATQIGTYATYKCDVCGGYSKSRKSIHTLSTLKSVPL